MRGKTVLIFFLYSVSQLLCLSGHAQYLWYQPPLNGHVKSVSGKASYFKDGKPDGTRPYEHFYNEEGQEEEMRAIFVSSTMTYDKSGNLIQQKVFDDGKCTGKYSYTYNQQNKLLEEKNSYGGHNKYFYNEQGQLVKMEEREDGNLDYIYHYTYTETGLCSEQKQYDSADSLLSTTTYLYDTAGHCIEEKFDQVTDNDYYPDYILTTRYNESGQWVAILKLNAEGNVLVEASATWDENGNILTLKHWYIDHKQASNNEEHAFEITYDQQGNWIKKVLFTNGEHKVTDERAITYY